MVHWPLELLLGCLALAWPHLGRMVTGTSIDRYLSQSMGMGEYRFKQIEDTFADFSVDSNLSL